MQSRQPNLVLAGFMGTGKSTVGPILAQAMCRPFVDTDSVIEQQAGVSVREIFARHGEAAFRALERHVCRRVAEEDALVVAVGGGALLDVRNCEALEGSGLLVLLFCRTDILVQRLRASAAHGERPLLAGGIEDTISRLLKEREPVYSSVPLQVDTTDLTPEQVAEKVLELYRDEIGAGVKAGAL